MIISRYVYQIILSKAETILFQGNTKRELTMPILFFFLRVYVCMYVFDKVKESEHVRGGGRTEEEGKLTPC